MGKRLFSVLIFVLILIGFGKVNSAEYRIGPGDILEIRFWQEADLTTNVRVGQDGMITIDVVGEIKAEGKTTNELQNEIVRQMSRLNPRISQAVVRVMDFQYQHVFLKGQVINPGKHTFEEIPDLWTIINEAGGVAEYGDLSRVTIIRGGDDAGKIEIVDVIDAIENGKLNNLPKIRRQDTIEIPRTPSGLPSADLNQQMNKKNIFYVVGAVNAPGPVQFQDNVDIMEALALAGGPTEGADLKHARIITRDGYYAQTIEVNLEKYSKTGTPARYVLRKEDTFLLPNRSGGIFGVGLGTAATVLGVISTAIIIYDRLSPDNTGTTVTVGN